MRNQLNNLIVITVLAAAIAPVAEVKAAVFNIPNGDVDALIAAIIVSNSNGEDNIINLPLGAVFTLMESFDGFNGLPPITGCVTINANGATIQRSSADGTAKFRLVWVSARGKLTLNGATLSGGAGGDGGAIFNVGTTTVNNCILQENVATSHGGAIMNGGMLTVNDSTISGNVATSGGGISSWMGTVTVTGSTIKNNTASVQGGGVELTDYGSMKIVSTTISGNSAAQDGGIRVGENAKVTAIDSTVADNVPAPYVGDVFAPVEELKLLPPVPDTLLRFGYKAKFGDFIGDGSVGMAVTAPGMTQIVDGDTVFGVGGAYVFLNVFDTNPLWEELSPLSPNANGNFGDGLAIGDFNGAGLDEVFIGEPGAIEGAVVKGRGYAFGPFWTEGLLFHNPAPGPNERNFASAIDTNGNRLLIGGRTGGNTCGSAWVYVHVEGGENPFVLKQQLFGPPQFNARYGAAVAIDGNVIVGGAPRYTHEGMTFIGCIVIHEFIDDEWESVATLVPSNAATGDEVGSAVAVRGHTIFAAAEMHDPPAGSNAGAVWVYERIDGTWVETAQLLASDSAQFGRFGASLHFRDDDTLFVGSTGTKHEGVETGGVYEFRRDADGAWVEVQKIVPLDAKVTTGLGSAMDTHGSLLVAGAARDFEAGGLAGSVYIFDLAGGPQCAPADVNCDGSVGVADLLILLADWGPCADCTPGTPGSCPADLDGDCTVGVADLLLLLANWG